MTFDIGNSITNEIKEKVFLSYSVWYSKCFIKVLISFLRVKKYIFIIEIIKLDISYSSWFLYISILLSLTALFSASGIERDTLVNSYGSWANSVSSINSSSQVNLSSLHLLLLLLLYCYYYVTYTRIILNKFHIIFQGIVLLSWMS